ncbi:MAG: aldehyde dehydrogenase family protein [Thermoactinomyces sp.]
MKQYQLFIDGKWVQSENSASNEGREVVGSGADATANDVKKAVDAAYRAYLGWTALTARERGDILYKAYQLMRVNEEELARCMTMEQGKPLPSAVCSGLRPVVCRRGEKDLR